MRVVRGVPAVGGFVSDAENSEMVGEEIMMATILEDRLLKLKSLSLKRGSHSPDSLMCVMEAVAFVAGEKWSDAPECACPIISSFMRSWNDALPTDDERDRLLKPLIPRLVNTRNKAAEKKRGIMAADWLIRVHMPAWLRLAGLTTQADALANLPEITAFAQFISLRDQIEAVRKDAAAAGDAARAAARAAAGAKLAPTIVTLQESALHLVERMIAAN